MIISTHKVNSKLLSVVNPDFQIEGFCFLFLLLYFQAFEVFYQKYIIFITHSFHFHAPLAGALLPLLESNVLKYHVYCRAPLTPQMVTAWHCLHHHSAQTFIVKGTKYLIILTQMPFPPNTYLTGLLSNPIH